jgi:tetratricopeptide (TPR) repeat protein
MRKIIYLILIFSFLFCSSARAFVDLQEEKLVSLAMRGQKMIFERRYEEGLRLFKDLEKRYPLSPIGIFGQMAVLEVKMLEHENFYLENEFNEMAKRGGKVVGQLMQRYHPSNEDLFFAGALIGLDGFFRARKGEWWGAYSKGTVSRQIFRGILKKDPGFVDAELGIGMYMYWRSVFTKEIAILPFFPDRRQEGIVIVEKVAREGNMARELARVNLGIIYFEEKRYADAIRIFDEYCTRYPNNIVLHTLYGKVLMADKKYDRAIEEFYKAVKIDPALSKQRYFAAMAIILKGDKNRFPEAKENLEQFSKNEKDRLWRSYALYWLGMLSEKQGDKQAAKGYYEEAVKLNKGLKSAKLKLRGLGGGI